jgi:hypothetical protein
MRDTVEALQREEDELEKRLFGTPESEETTKDKATGSLEVGSIAHTEEKELVAQPPKSAIEVTSGDTRGEDWEKRYKNLRSSRDEKLYEAKSQLSNSLETIKILQQRIRELEKARPVVDPMKDLFTTEETETLGDVTVEAVRKATMKATEIATKPLQEALESERKLREEQQNQLADRSKREAYDIFLSRIERAVPNWESINVDPKFIDWMEAPDLDGTLRRIYFQRAEQQGNAALIIRYMKEYEGSVVQLKDNLAAKVTPVGDTIGATQVKDKGKQELISIAFVNKFYDDLARGRYRGKESEAERIETLIDKATMEGRLKA